MRDRAGDGQRRGALDALLLGEDFDGEIDMVEMQRSALGRDRTTRFLRGRSDRRLAGLDRLRGGGKGGERQGRGGEEQMGADGSLLQAIRRMRGS
ncbi:hypothetical protein [Sphingomonas sp. R-74633]|uniref:hypothetical protein n=1 Tax=Sphingomonas sp. R-74633 TaxID=2751188 RepID=UPI00211E0BB8|nr:hypothetical protein [Sphingomonas sp. R-74633]